MEKKIADSIQAEIGKDYVFGPRKEFTVPFVKEQDGHEIFKVYGTPALDAPLQVVKEAERILTLDQVREMLGSLPPMRRLGVIVENA